MSEHNINEINLDYLIKILAEQRAFAKIDLLSNLRIITELDKKTIQEIKSECFKEYESEYQA